MLRHAVVAGVEHPPGHSHRVAGRGELLHDLVEEAAVPPHREALHVLEHEGPGVELGDDADELADQAVARVVERAVADQREALARRAAEHAVDPAPVELGGLGDVFAR